MPDTYNMKYVEYIVLVGHLSLFCLSDGKTPNTQVAGTNVVESFMVDRCHGPEYRKHWVDRSLKVSLLHTVSEDYEVDCTVTYSAKYPAEQLMVSFEKIGISCDPQSSDSLRIYDGEDDQVQLTPQRSGICGTCGNAEGENTIDCKSFLYRSKYSSSLTFVYWGTPSKDFNGFTAILTSQKRPFANGTCGSNTFMCKKDHYCIAEELQCDGYRNCKDGTDEKNCVILPDHTGFHETRGAESIGMLVGGSISILVLMIVAVWLGIVCVKRMITKRECERRQQIYHGGPVIDADHEPPFVPGNATRPRPAPLHPLSPTVPPGPPPLYVEHPVGHTYFSQYDLPPPYTPDGCDTAGLLNQSQGYSLDTPPAYRTIDPNFSSMGRPVIDGQYNANVYVFPNVDGIVPVHTTQIMDLDNNPTNNHISDNLVSPVNNNNSHYVSRACQVGRSIEPIAEVQQAANSTTRTKPSEDESSDNIAEGVLAQPSENNIYLADNLEIPAVYSETGTSEPQNLAIEEEKNVHFYRKRVHKVE